MKANIRNVKKGDIYIADLGKNKGSVQSGVRPVVVVSNDTNNKYSTVINILPITTHSRDLPVHVKLGKDTGLSHTSYALAEQSSTINKDQLINKIGKCGEIDIMKINTAILIQKGIQITDINNDLIINHT